MPYNCTLQTRIVWCKQFTVRKSTNNYNIILLLNLICHGIIFGRAMLLDTVNLSLSEYKREVKYKNNNIVPTFFCFLLNMVMLLRTSLLSSAPPGPLNRLAKDVRLFLLSAALVSATAPARSTWGDPGGVEASLSVPSGNIKFIISLGSLRTTWLDDLAKQCWWHTHDWSQGTTNRPCWTHNKVKQTTCISHEYVTFLSSKSGHWF